ncbi:MAG: 5-formyltetrahydrofolate cyclo-ligase [Nitrososphaerota archaeon]
MSLREQKQRIREHVWDLLVREQVARPPFPIRGRIPNFVGAEAAAEKLLLLESFRSARTVKVSPDSPQRPVRELCMKMGKKLVMPTPRLREGFLLLEPSKISEHNYRQASTIRGGFTFGEKVEPESLDTIDFVVVGSVAVSRGGARVGKGEGYSEIEYAILRMLGRVSEDTPITTTVHPLQIVGEIPVEEFDVSVDYIVTEAGLVATHTRLSRPRGIIWHLLSDKKMEEIPLLKRLRKT